MVNLHVFSIFLLSLGFSENRKAGYSKHHMPPQVWDTRQVHNAKMTNGQVQVGRHGYQVGARRP